MDDMKAIYLFVLTITSSLSISNVTFGDQLTSEKYKRLGEVPESVWEVLSTKSIYFGHNSVGRNILSGVKKLLNENPQIKLTIKETYNPKEFAPGTLAHSKIGYNRDPQSKLTAFDFYMNVGGASASDVAFFKYCYVDINRETNVDEVFSDYIFKIKRLKTAYPNTIFLHTTVPLTTIQSGVKASIKKVIGRPLAGVQENIKRNLFNELLRNEFGETDPIFDIAKIESTFPDGQRSSFTINDKQFYSLVPEYSYDGSHLNETGQRVLAEHLLLLLVDLF